MAGGASTFLGAGVGTFFSGTGFLGTSGTLKISNKVKVTPFTYKSSLILGFSGHVIDNLTVSL